MHVTLTSHEPSQGMRRLELRKHDLICPAVGGVCGVGRRHIQGGDGEVFSFLSSWNNSLEALNDWDKVNALVSGIHELLGCLHPPAWSSAKFYPLSWLRHSCVVNHDHIHTTTTTIQG